MSRSAVWVLALVLAVMCPSGSAMQSEGQETIQPQFSLALSPAGAEQRIGSPVLIAVTVKILASEPTGWSVVQKEPIYRAFRFLLTHDGAESEKSRFHKILRGEQAPDRPSDLSGDAALVALQPGSSQKIVFDLAKLYDLKQPGTYELTFSRREENPSLVITSNVLTLQIK